MKYIQKDRNESGITRFVRLWINSEVKGGNTLEGVFADLAFGGCASGIVGPLIYTRDCVKFTQKYIVEILELIQDYTDFAGEPPEILQDISADKLAWFAFEYTADRIRSELGMD